jgi:hypothetical protein
MNVYGGNMEVGCGLWTSKQKISKGLGMIFGSLCFACIYSQLLLVSNGKQQQN